jgi:hypothetical protein
MFFLDDNRDTKRTLGIRDKQILYDRAKGRCENPTCRKKISFGEMIPGHKKAWSEGGKTTLANSVCLCYACNKKQGKDSWAVFLKKQGYKDPKVKEKQIIKQHLETLSLKQFKYLADKHHIKVKGQVVDNWWYGSYTKPPTKKQYITKLSGIVTAKDLGSVPKEAPKLAKKKTRRKSDDSWF